MQYIGLGIRKSFLNKINPYIEICLENNYYLEHDNNFTLDEEVEIGIKNFAEFFNIEIFRFREKSKKGIRNQESSDSICLDIANIHLISGHKSKFLKFLIEYKDMLPESFFLIFTDIWKIEELDFKIRYMSTDLINVINYFNDNIGWEMILYDYKGDSLAFHYNIPLVFEINNA
jgi:hypothetical protein